MKANFEKFVKIGAMVLAATPLATFGGTLFVDDDNYNEAYATYQDYIANGFDGSTKAKAFGTIQMAIDAASENDVIKVCPGVYTNGTADTVSFSHSTYKNVKQKARVYVTKKLTLESTDGKENTVVRGARGTISSNGSNSAYYVDGVTCIVVADAATGSIVRGLTIENGWPHQSAFKSSMGAGGIIRANTSGASDFLVTDSAFDTCYGRGGGAIAGGTAIRCSFTNCGSTYGGGVSYKTCFYNCIFNRNGMPEHGAYADLYDSVAVNCTIVNERKSNVTGARGVTRLYNSVNYSHYVTNAASATTVVASNCVSEAQLSSDSHELTMIDAARLDQMTNVCVCPIVDDLRPVKGGILDGTGDRAYLADFDWLPADEINKDFDGNAIASTDSLPIGAILPAAEVKSGVIVSAVNGYLHNFDGYDQVSQFSYFQSTAWPVSVKIKPSVTQTSGKTFVNISLLGKSIFPGRHDAIVQMMPKAGLAISLSNYNLAKYEYYVGGEGASDSNDGSKDAPFATIQRAIDQNIPDYEAASRTWGWPTTIHVRPGHYGVNTGIYANEPGNLDTNSANFGLRSSINVPKNLILHVIADGGPDVTFIEGAPDPETGDVGSGATRCLGVNSSAVCAFSGFTFQDGYAESYANYDNKNLSPLIGVRNESAQFYDCVFTRAHGRTACLCGWYHRCLFTANTNCDAAVAYMTTLSSCIIANNNRSMSYALYNNVYAFNCSIYESVNKSSIQNRNGTIVNAAYDATGTMINFQDAGSTIAGSIIKASSQSTQTRYGDGMIRADPFFADPTKFDFRLNTCAENPSLAIGRGVLEDPYGKFTHTQLLTYVRADFSNRSLVDANGGIYAGAVAKTRQASEAVYAGPDGDDDNNDGRTPDSPLTLQGATACYRPANDGKKVIAKSGTYNTGSQLYTGRAHNEGLTQGTVRCRVVVPAGFTLESAEGPEKTIIVGAADTTTDMYDLGLGPDAIRCAFVDNNAILKGFTLTGGHTDYYDSNETRYDKAYQDNFWGAGVLGRSYTTNPAIVENCIVSNNFADLGGAGGYAVFHGCRVVHNVGYRYGGFFRMGGAYNCYVADCRGPRVCDVINVCVNCTFGEKCWNYNSESATYCFENVSGGTKIWNVLICSETPKGFVMGSSSDIRNFIAPKGFKPSATSLSGCTWSGEILTNEYTVAEMSALYTNGVPLVRTAPSVDKGYAEATNHLRSTATDASGVAKRIANGTLDIGALEYDWYADYSKALGRRIAVTNATSNVFEGNDNQVTLHPADAMALLWTGSERGCSYTIGVNFSDAGSGEFTVKLNGEEIGKLTQTGTVSFSNALTENALEFAYTGEGTATITGLNRFQGTVLMIR